MGVCICIDVCVICDLIFFLKEFFGCSVGGGWDGNGGVVRKLVRDGGKLDWDGGGNILIFECSLGDKFDKM